MMTGAPPTAALPTGPSGRIWLAAGGTGGHIYPALEVRRALAEAAPGLSISCFCGNRPGELAIYRNHGIEPTILPLSGRRRGALEQFRFGLQFLSAARQCRSAAALERPRAAVGFGGYPSVPVLWAARRAGAVTMIQEQNALPGLANRLLARGAARIFAGLPVTEGGFPPDKLRVTGNPVRAELLRRVDPAEARRQLGLPAEGRVVLCFGGSLGARGLNELILKALESKAARRWHWLWAAGPDHFEQLERERGTRPGLAESVTLVPYLTEMAEAYAVADVVICRAGAITLAELAALGKPSILVPLPTSAKDHQRANARRFQDEGAGVLVEEKDAEAGQKIVTCLEQFERDCDKLTALGEAARRLGHPGAAREIVGEILRLLA